MNVHNITSASTASSRSSSSTFYEDLLFIELALFNQKLADGLEPYNAELPLMPPKNGFSNNHPEGQRWWTHTVG